jgi:hypothetical protein
MRVTVAVTITASGDLLPFNVCLQGETRKTVCTRVCSVEPGNQPGIDQYHPSPKKFPIAVFFVACIFDTANSLTILPPSFPFKNKQRRQQIFTGRYGHGNCDPHCRASRRPDIDIPRSDVVVVVVVVVAMEDVVVVVIVVLVAFM